MCNPTCIFRAPEYRRPLRASSPGLLWLDEGSCFYGCGTVAVWACASALLWSPPLLPAMPGKEFGFSSQSSQEPQQGQVLHLWGLSVVGYNVPSSSQGGWAPRGEMPLGGCVPVLLGSADVYPSFTHPHLPAGAWRPAACWGRASEWAVLPNRWKCSG